MTDYTGNLPPAGWYPDPYGAPHERWWDGAQWTDHTNVPAAPEPVVAAPVYPEPVQQAPAQAEPVQAEPVQAAPVQQEPVIPSYLTNEQAYQAPQQTSEPAYQAPQQTAEQAYQAPQQTSEPAYQAPASAWDTPVAAAGSSFDDIFATGQSAAQQDYTQQASAQQPYAQPQAYAQPANAQPTSVSYAEQHPQAFPMANTSTSPDFGDLIAGNASDPLDQWSNQEYEEPPRNTLATVGLTFGVLSFIIPGVAGLVGLVTSALGLVRSGRFKQEDGVALGRGKSVAGIALSLIGSAASIAAVLFVLPGIINPTGGGADDTASEVVANAPKTDFGNIALADGEKGTILFAGTTDPSIQFSVTGITPNPTCTEDPALVLSPENGQFVAITMELTTAAEYASAMSSGALLQIASADFVGLLPDGTTVLNSDAGISCVPEAEQLPTELPAGATTTGTVILDLSPETTSFSYSPTGVTGLESTTTRWEWAIPR